MVLSEYLLATHTFEMVRDSAETGFGGEAKEEDVNKLRDIFKLYARTSPSFAAELLVAFTFPAQ